MLDAVRIALIGACGFTGEQLAELLYEHPRANLTYLSSVLDKEEPYSAIFPRFSQRIDQTCKQLDLDEAADAADIVFLALPHCISSKFAPFFLEKGKIVIDLSADYRLHDVAVYKKFYGIDHPNPSTIKKAVYGLPELNREIATWFQDRFSVSVDPESEILPVIGSKEGIAHLPLGIINPKDKVLLTDPAYPAYRPTVEFAGGKITNIPLKASNNFLPDLKKIADIKDPKMIVVNYPNNPTAATATREFYEGLVALAQEKQFVILSDMAYSEVYYDGEKPISLFEIEGAKDVAIEFHSLSKTY